MKRSIFWLFSLGIFLFSITTPIPTKAQPASLWSRVPLTEISSYPAGLPLQNVQHIAAGYSHTCTVSMDGDVLCWGNNASGRLGDQTTINRPVPVYVKGLAGKAEQVSSGSEHTCALLLSGAVQCWGNNFYGQLGNGTKTNSSIPITVVGLSSGVKEIAVASGYTCALLTGGTVQCWGSNGFGQLGNGTTTNSLVPTSVIGLNGVESISAEYTHACAVLTTTGEVQCWGNNLYGQLGDGTQLHHTTPVAVPGLSGVIEIQTGGAHTCALQSGGMVKCWGGNFNGQLGDGTMTNSLIPVTVTGLASGVSSISMGGYHACALLDSQGLKCWGKNENGQLGDKTITLYRNTPIDVLALNGGAAEVHAGGYHTCAILVDGMVQCWGNNEYGQLGNGYQQEYTVPVAVRNLSAELISGGGTHTCVKLAGGAVECWGANSSGQLGDGTTTNAAIPVSVLSMTDAMKITTGGFHTCALLSNGVAQCWGDNRYGQLGDRTLTDRAIPVSVVDLGTGVDSIVAGEFHTCALLVSGVVQCWGQNTNGELGDGTTTSSAAPVTVMNLASGVKAITAGGAHACALLITGMVQCWGQNAYGQLGDGTTTFSPTPVTVMNLAGAAIAIAAGGSHTCAMLANGIVQCWGKNADGELGDGTTKDKVFPVSVVGLMGEIMSLVAGGGNTCALLAMGSVYCWGNRAGDGSMALRLTPVVVTNLTKGVEFIAAGGSHTCAIAAGGEVVCWGLNRDGQLGQGAAATSSVPVSVRAPLPPTVTAINPARGRNDRPVHITISGEGFLDGAVVRLEPGLVALENVVVVDDFTLTATVPRGLAEGQYSLLVNNPSSDIAIVDHAYTVWNVAFRGDLYAFDLDFDLEPNMVFFPVTEPVNLRLTLRRLGGVDSLDIQDVQVNFYQVDPISLQDILIDSCSISLSPDSHFTSTLVQWTPPGMGEFVLKAVIDPELKIDEFDEENNIITRQATVLPFLGDNVAPTVTGVTINNGQAFTSDRAVTVHSSAADAGAGNSHLLLIEYTFDQALNTWHAVQATPWIPYLEAQNKSWVLDPSPGAHYLQVWASDRAGNISPQAMLAIINYLPATDFISVGEVRIYRHWFALPQMATLTLTSHANTDLYIWDQGDNSVAQSLDAASHHVEFTSSNQLYQYEIETAISTAFIFQEQTSAVSAVGEEDMKLHPRRSPYTSFAPLNAETGVPSAPLVSYRTLFPLLWRK